jgi:roadblock/LC7 domain-containing protein
MNKLDQLLETNGVRVAFEFKPDGELIDYRAKTNTSREMAAMMARYCATVTMQFQTLANSFTMASEMSWVPQRGWVYSSQDWTVVIGNGGYRGVFVETAKLDLNRIFEVLVN